MFYIKLLKIKHLSVIGGFRNSCLYVLYRKTILNNLANFPGKYWRRCTFLHVGRLKFPTFIQNYSKTTALHLFSRDVSGNPPEKFPEKLFFRMVFQRRI